MNIPIATGERIYTRYGFRRIMEAHAADILQPDIGNTGGIRETKKIAAMAETYNMRIQPHNFYSPVCTAASLQLDAKIANFYMQELYPYRKPEHFAIVDHAPELDIKTVTCHSEPPGAGGRTEGGPGSAVSLGYSVRPSAAGYASRSAKISATRRYDSFVS